MHLEVSVFFFGGGGGRSFYRVSCISGTFLKPSLLKFLQYIGLRLCWRHSNPKDIPFNNTSHIAAIRLDPHYF